MQKHSYLLCKYLAKEKIQVVLFHPQTKNYTSQKQSELFSDEELTYIEWIEVPKPPKYSFPGHYLYEQWLYSKGCFNVLKTIKDIRFIYAKGLTSWYLLKKKDQLDCKIGINIHGYEFLQIQANTKEKWNALLLSGPFRYIHRHADFVFSYGGNVTYYIQKLGVSNNRIVEIPGAVEANWLRTDLSLSPGSNLRKFFFIGRFERRKGIEEINQALTALGEAVDFEFHFAGPIPDEKKIVLPHVHYHGLLTSKEQIIDLMDSMDVLVCPSYSEGMPNVIMEAMSRGCAVIATNVGAVSLLVDQQNGWLIEPASIAGLKKAIRFAAECDPDIIENMKKASLDRIAKNFTWDIIGKKTAEFLVNRY